MGFNQQLRQYEDNLLDDYLDVEEDEDVDDYMYEEDDDAKEDN